MLHCKVEMQVSSKSMMKHAFAKLLDGESVLTNYPLCFLKNTKACEGCKNKKENKKMTTQDFFSQRI